MYLATQALAVAADNGGGDVFSWISSASGSGKSAAQGVGGLIAVVLTLLGAWRAKGAIAGIVAAGIAATVFIWFVHHVSDSGIQDKVTKTVDNGSAQIGQLNRAPTASGIRITGLDRGA